MKAILLAAGLGTRLRPLTDHIPKCLIPIKEKPLLTWWLILLERYGIQEVLINLHYLPHLVKDFIKAYKGPLSITSYYEETLLGSAGTLLANRLFMETEDAVLICYADNLTNANLTRLITFHRKQGALLTMGVFEPDNPRGAGMVELDSKGKVTRFEEKPDPPFGLYANAGIYVASPRILQYIPQLTPCDIGYNLLPRLVGFMYAHPIDGYLRDIGTLEAYRKAEEEWTGDY